MGQKNKVLKDFYTLAKYLKKTSKIKDLEAYKNNFAAFLLHARHLISYDFIVPYCKDKRVLDIGCFIAYGEKRFSLETKETIAIDSDKEALAFAKKRKIPNLILMEVDARDLPFEKESFDIVLAFQLIEHIPKKDVKNFLSEIKKILKPNGLLFITTPNRKFRLLPFQRPFNSEHYQEFTAKKLYKELKSIFKEVKIEGIRARKWIEDIEKDRVRISPYKVYFYNPLYRILRFILPRTIKNKFKQIKESKEVQDCSKSTNNTRFKKLWQKFSINDFYLTDSNLDKSITLFAICKK